MTQSLSINIQTRHAVTVNRYAAGQGKEAMEKIQRLARAVQRELSAAETLADAMVLQKKIGMIDQIATDYLASMKAGLMNGAGEFAEYEAEFQYAALSAVTTATIAPVSQQIVNGLMKAPMELLGGKKNQKITPEAAIDLFATDKRREIKRAIQVGVLQGVSTQRIGAEIRGLVQGRQSYQADALARTIIHHVSHEASQAVHQSNKDVISHERWVSTLDGRTTLTCAALDGKEFNLGEGPPAPRHWNCRSRRVAVVKPQFQILGRTGQRASMDGPVSARTTFGSWLKKQSAEFQNEYLGPERAKLFRSGGLSIDSFTDPWGRVYTLEQLRALNPLVLTD